MADGFSARTAPNRKGARPASERRLSGPRCGERPLSVSRDVPWLFKLLGAFTVIGLQVLFSLEVGIYSEPLSPTGAEALKGPAAAVAALPSTPLDRVRVDPAATAQRLEPAQWAGPAAAPEAFLRSPARHHPWIGDGSALFSGLILLGASDPALRPQLARVR